MLTPVDIQRIRDRAAPDVKDLHSRQQLIARIKRHRLDVEAMAVAIERLQTVVYRQAGEMAVQDMRIAEYEKRLEREWTSR